MGTGYRYWSRDHHCSQNRQLAPTLQKGDVVVMDNLPGSQGCRSSMSMQGARRMAAIPATIFAGPEPVRAGFLKALHT